MSDAATFRKISLSKRNTVDGCGGGGAPAPLDPLVQTVQTIESRYISNPIRFCLLIGNKSICMRIQSQSVSWQQIIQHDHPASSRNCLNVT